MLCAHCGNEIDEAEETFPCCENPLLDEKSDTTIEYDAASDSQKASDEVCSKDDEYGVWSFFDGSYDFEEESDEYLFEDEFQEVYDDTGEASDDIPMAAFKPVDFHNESKGVHALYSEEVGRHVSISSFVAIAFTILVIVLSFVFVTHVFNENAREETEDAIAREEMGSHDEALYLLGYGAGEGYESESESESQPDDADSNG